MIFFLLCKLYWFLSNRTNKCFSSNTVYVSLEKAHNKLIREWLGVICKCHINMLLAFVAPKDIKIYGWHFWRGGFIFFFFNSRTFSPTNIWNKALEVARDAFGCNF